MTSIFGALLISLIGSSVVMAAPTSTVDGNTVVDRMVSNPIANGKLDTVSCRLPQDIGGPSLHIRHYGPEICLSNRVWSELARNHLRVTEDGIITADIPVTPPNTGESFVNRFGR
jgi:hypothetical protein